MAYSKGGSIEAVDFNSFQSSIMGVYDVGAGNTGYGQVSGSAATATAVPTVAAGNRVQSSEWTDLQSKINACALHQGTNIAIVPPA